MRIQIGFRQDISDNVCQIGFIELPRGEVYVHPQGQVAREAILPPTYLGAGLLEHPPPYVADQAAFFCDGDELRGEHQATLRVIPTYPRFQSSYLPSLER